MEKRKLIEMGTLSRGRSQHRPRNDLKLYGGKYPFIQTGDVKNANLYIEKYSQTYNDFGLNQSKLWPENTLCITIAANIADTGILSFPACFPDSIIGFTATKGKTDVRYVKYCFDLLQKSIQNMSKGSTQDNLSMEKLEQLEFNCPSFENQQKISAVLSSLDDKIALNNRINAKLEQMAKRLYDYWFVQFDFPVSCHSELVSDSHSEEMLNQVQHDERIKPYKSTGGKMVWNEELKREIPEGWEVKSINDISVSYRGVGYTADDEKSETDENVVLILRGNNISNNHIVFDSNTVYLDKTFVSPDQEIHKFDLVMTMSSGSKEHVGKSAMFLYDSSHSYGAFCNKITPNKDCQYFLENYLHSEYFKKYIKVTCSGTGINNLTNEHFDKAKFAFPDDEVLNAFNEKMKAIYEKRGVLEQENLKLTSMRDKLLPLLMNGQVVVE